MNCIEYVDMCMSLMEKNWIDGKIVQKMKNFHYEMNAAWRIRRAFAAVFLMEWKIIKLGFAYVFKKGIFYLIAKEFFREEEESNAIKINREFFILSLTKSCEIMDHQAAKNPLKNEFKPSQQHTNENFFHQIDYIIKSFLCFKNISGEKI